MLRSEIQKQIQAAVAACWPALEQPRPSGKDIATPAFDVVVPEQREHGDYASNIGLVLARELKKNPMEVAQELAKKLSHPDIFSRVEVAKPGFLNFFINDVVFFRELDRVVKNPDVYGTSSTGEGKTVMIDYFQLNIAKRPHIGHIRSAIIGDALKRMFLSQGYAAVSDTHVGDWGTQFGILLLGYKEAGADLHTKEIVADPFGELEEMYLAENGRIKEDLSRREQAKSEFAKLEQGDAQNRKIWEWMVDISMQKLFETANRLGLLPFDEHRGESFYEDKMQPIVELALQKDIAKKTDDGAVIVDLTADGLDDAVLIKSDGASTYLLRDLATIHYRKEHWNFWKNLYVVDVRQSHHFKQVFRVAELLGFDGVSGMSEHVSYGFMKLPKGGAISTRGGSGISLEKVLDEAQERSRAVIEQKNPHLSDADTVARMVGVGALKYFDLAHHRTSDITFDWDRALSFEGNTGPYLQYTHARLKSILRKSGVKTPRSVPDHTLVSVERNLIVALLRFPEAIEDGLAIRSPHVLAAYLYDVAARANELYHAIPVVTEADNEKKLFLLALVSATASTLKKGLYLLGIDAPEQM
jgi:arginyl-tRNA synthetase